MNLRLVLWLAQGTAPCPTTLMFAIFLSHSRLMDIFKFHFRAKRLGNKLFYVARCRSMDMWSGLKVEMKPRELKIHFSPFPSFLQALEI